MTPRIFAIVVGYHPDLAVLSALCAAAAADARVIVVDNTEGGGIAAGALGAAVEVITLGANTGIARAQNVGIARALELGADVVVFFDQDSRIPGGFILRLTRRLDPTRAEVAAPRYVDEADGFELPSIRLGRLGWPRPVTSGGGLEPLPVDIVIASGTAATRPVFATAGVLDESLFIDSVDTDWCLRCRAQGIPICVVPEAMMSHRIGLATRSVGPFRVLLHSPARCYYQIRNSLLLFRRPHIPFLFALRETAGVVASRTLLLFFVANRAAYLEAYISAIKDGLSGITGKRSV